MSFQKLTKLIEENKHLFTKTEYSTLTSIVQNANERKILTKDTYSQKDIIKEDSHKNSNIAAVNSQSKSYDKENCIPPSETISTAFEEHKSSTSVTTNPEISTTDSNNFDTSTYITQSSMNSEAERYKQEGNTFFQNKQYEDAVFAYTKAIDSDPMNKIYYSNRAAAYANLNMRENGIDDCLNAIKIDNNYVKAYVRLGDFYFNYDNKKARENYEKALELDPGNKALSEKIQALDPISNIGDTSDVDWKKMMNNPEIMEMVNSMCKNGDKNKSKEELEDMIGSFFNRKK